MQEVEVQNDALETYREFLISPQHWKNFSGCAAEFINEELMKNKFTALSGTYLTLSKQNEQGYGICEIKNGRCFPEMGEYTEQSGVKFRPCAWFNLQDRQLYTFETNKLLTPEQTKIFIGK